MVKGGKETLPWSSSRLRPNFIKGKETSFLGLEEEKKRKESKKIYPRGRGPGPQSQKKQRLIWKRENDNGKQAQAGAKKVPPKSSRI